jgi:hypothetical protein
MQGYFLVVAPMQGVFGFKVSTKIEAFSDVVHKNYAGALVAVLIVGLLVSITILVLFVLHARGKIDLLKHFRPKVEIQKVVSEEKREISRILEMSI